MIKKIVIVLCALVNISSFGCFLPQLDKKQTSFNDIPLLFEFLPQQDIIKVYGLTQSWVQVSEALRVKAKYSINEVALKIIQNLNAGKFSPEAGKSYVFNPDRSVQEYDTQKTHKNYFKVDILTHHHEVSAPHRLLPSIKKNCLYVQGVGYAKK